MTILNEIIDRRAVQRLDKNTGERLDQEFIASEKSYKTGDKDAVVDGRPPVGDDPCHAAISPGRKPPGLRQDARPGRLRNRHGWRKTDREGRLGFPDSIVDTLELNYHVHPRGMDTASNTHRPDSATTRENFYV
jgi:hypothetical protein